MILDAITVFLQRILNQKLVINKYAKIGSVGIWERERGRSASSVFICFQEELF